MIELVFEEKYWGCCRMKANQYNNTYCVRSLQFGCYCCHNNMGFFVVSFSFLFLFLFQNRKYVGRFIVEKKGKLFSLLAFFLATMNIKLMRGGECLQFFFLNSIQFNL